MTGTVPAGHTGFVTVSVYERVGGLEFFRRLVNEFYDRVAADPVLLAIYPPPAPDDLAPARERLTLFLSQYWGGPTTYRDERGHPRLRMRHAPFPVTLDARDRWLDCMRGALDAVGVAGAERDELWAYFEMAADAMRNREG